MKKVKVNSLPTGFTINTKLLPYMTISQCDATTSILEKALMLVNIAIRNSFDLSVVRSSRIELDFSTKCAEMTNEWVDDGMTSGPLTNDRVVLYQKNITSHIEKVAARKKFLLLHLELTDDELLLVIPNVK